MRRSLRMMLEQQKRTAAREAAVGRVMEKRFRLTRLQCDTLLWRARRYLNDDQAEAADALLELVPKPVVERFLDWYFAEEIRKEDA